MTDTIQRRLAGPAVFMALLLVVTAGKWNPYVEIKGVYHGAEREFRYNSLSAGSYFKAAPWLKVGAFYRLQGGARHIEDWIVALPDNYSWNDVSGRYESLIYLDAGRKLGLTYVIMPDREPVVNLSLNYNLYFALNFGDAALYAHGPYFSVIGHLNEWFKLEGRVNYLMKTYRKTEFGGSWTLHSRHLVIGLGAIFTPDFLSGK